MDVFRRDEMTVKKLLYSFEHVFSFGLNLPEL